jgi:hypothetical protein
MIGAILMKLGLAPAIISINISVLLYVACVSYFYFL